MNVEKRREIGVRLRTARMLARYSQITAAKELHVSQQTIGGWESGRSMPPLEIVYNICELYGVSSGYVTLAQATPNARRFDFCPPDGRALCKALQAENSACCDSILPVPQQN